MSADKALWNMFWHCFQNGFQQGNLRKACVSNQACWRRWRDPRCFFFDWKKPRFVESGGEAHALEVSPGKVFIDLRWGGGRRVSALSVPSSQGLFLWRLASSCMSEFIFKFMHEWLPLHMLVWYSICVYKMLFTWSQKKALHSWPSAKWLKGLC